MQTNSKNILVDRYKNVLIVRFTAFGDVAMTVPVVYSVCAAYPDTHFIFMTRHVASTLFVNAPDNLEVIGVNLEQDYPGIKGLYQLYKYITASYHIDVVIDLHDVFSTKLLSMFFRCAGIPTKHINKGTNGKRALTRQRNKRMFPLISARERYREVFYRAGFVFQESFKSIFPQGKAPFNEFAQITTPKKEGERWIAIAPFAKYDTKIYPLQLMKKVLDEIAGWPSTRVFLLGGDGSECEVLSKWSSEYDNVMSLAEKRYGFPKELALLSYCDVMLSMDSVNMQLASLVCVPVVSIWGATHPYCGFLGWHQDIHDAVQLNMLCRPCSVVGDKQCRYHDCFCLRGITPALIIKHINTVLSRKK